MEEIDQALALLDEDSGPRHLKLVLEWDLEAKERLVSIVNSRYRALQPISIIQQCNCNSILQYHCR